MISEGEANIKNPHAFGISVFASIHSHKQAWLVHECKNPSALLKGFLCAEEEIICDDL